MSFFKKILEFLESIFNRSSPEIQKKLQRRKLEGELANFSPKLYANGKTTGNFAEAIRIMYVNTKKLDNLFCETVGGTDVGRQMRFRMQLVLTGFSATEQQDIDSLSYEQRKMEILEDGGDDDRRVLDVQRGRLERIVSALNNTAFVAMDKNLLALHQFADICHYNYANILQKVDPNFNFADENYAPSYVDVPLSDLGQVFEDLYYHCADFKITNGIANAVQALLQLRYGERLSQKERDEYIDNIKKISSVINNIFVSEHLLAIVRLVKENPSYAPSKISYRESARIDFSNKLQSQFKTDSTRIKAEIKDEKIRSELISLFSGQPLLQLTGLTSEIAEKLHSNSELSLTSLMPLQILKTFLHTYLTENIIALLNDIVVEGFFASQTLKTDFSAIVYSTLECLEKLEEFEHSFTKDGSNDISLLEGYISDVKRDPSFYKKMESMVASINSQSEQLIQTETTALQQLYTTLTEIIADSKKLSSELIQNLKVLLNSPRNKEATNTLEHQLPHWRFFFEIMSNYTVVSIRDRK